jgi:hypothetical protein
VHFSRLLLLPETVDDYVGADNPVRFIDAFVDQLDLARRDLAALHRRRRAVLVMRRVISYTLQLWLFDRVLSPILGPVASEI